MSKMTDTTTVDTNKNSNNAAASHDTSLMDRLVEDLSSFPEDIQESLIHEILSNTSDFKRCIDGKQDNADSRARAKKAIFLNAAIWIRRHCEP